MQFNVTTDYGIRVVLYLAQKNGIASSADISNAMGIPCSYMHKVTRALKHADILREKRGAHGGFELKKDLDDLSLLTIMGAFEKTVKINRCLEDDEFCSRDGTSSCPVRELYLDAQTEFHKRLDVKISALLKQ